MNNEPMTEDAIIGKATLAGMKKSVVRCWVANPFLMKEIENIYEDCSRNAESH